MLSQLKTLRFRGQPIYYLEAADGINWVLIRPLCDVLGVEAEQQVERIKDDEILGPEQGVHPV